MAYIKAASRDTILFTVQISNQPDVFLTFVRSLNRLLLQYQFNIYFFVTVSGEMDFVTKLKLGSCFTFIFGGSYSLIAWVLENMTLVVIMDSSHQQFILALTKIGLDMCINTSLNNSGLLQIQALDIEISIVGICAVYFFNLSMPKFLQKMATIKIYKCKKPTLFGQTFSTHSTMELKFFIVTIRCGIAYHKNFFFEDLDIKFSTWQRIQDQNFSKTW